MKALKYQLKFKVNGSSYLTCVQIPKHTHIYKHIYLQVLIAWRHYTIGRSIKYAFENTFVYCCSHCDVEAPILTPPSPQWRPLMELLVHFICSFVVHFWVSLQRLWAFISICGSVYVRLFKNIKVSTHACAVYATYVNRLWHSNADWMQTHTSEMVVSRCLNGRRH